MSSLENMHALVKHLQSLREPERQKRSAQSTVSDLPVQQRRTVKPRRLTQSKTQVPEQTT